jgi:hypothetical protein
MYFSHFLVKAESAVRCLLHVQQQHDFRLMLFAQLKYILCIIVVVQVILNTQPVITVQLLGFTSDGGITRSRSVIANLNVGDRLYVTLLSGTCISTGYFTQFTGFRLF